MRNAKVAVILTLFAANVLTGAALGGQTNACDGSSLPVEARTLLSSRFPEFRLVTPGDLGPDEFEEWHPNNQNRCPGYLHGTFGVSLAGYAISLIQRASPTETNQMLVFLRHDGHGYSVHVLSPSSQVVAHTLVVSLGAPGEYHPVEGGRTLTTRWPVILYEAIDAGIEGYYYAGGSWHSVLLSN